MNENQLQEMLRKAYPDNIVRKLSDLSFYNELRDVASSKGMKPREYVFSLGYISQVEWRSSESGIMVSEQDVIKSLKEVYSDGNVGKLTELPFYTSLRNIAANKGMKPREYVFSIFRDSGINIENTIEFSVNDITNDLNGPVDYVSLRRIISDYDVSASEMAKLTGRSRQRVSQIVNSSNKGLNTNGWNIPLSGDEIEDIINLILQTRFVLETDMSYIRIISNIEYFEEKGVIYKKGNNIKCVFSLPQEIKEAIRSQMMDTFSEQAFEVVNHLQSLWETQGSIIDNGKKKVLLRSLDRDRIRKVSDEHQMEMEDFLDLFDFTPEFPLLTRDDLIEILRSHLIPGTTNKIQLLPSDDDYRIFSVRAYNNNSTLNEYIRSFGFEKINLVRTREPNTTMINARRNTQIQRAKTYIEKNCIIDDNKVYISSQEPFYQFFRQLAFELGSDMNTVLEEWGYRRVWRHRSAYYSYRNTIDRFKQRIRDYYIVEGNDIFIPESAALYQELQEYSYGNRKTIGDLLSEWGFNMLTADKLPNGYSTIEETDAISSMIELDFEAYHELVKRRYQVREGIVYISSNDPFYHQFRQACYKNGYDFTSLINEWGFKRILARELVETDSPYDYTDDLLAQMEARWDDSTLLEYLDNNSIDGVVNLRKDSRIYKIVYWKAKAHNMRTVEYGRYLGYDFHVLNKGQNEPIISVKTVENEEAIMEKFVASKISELEEITSSYAREQVSDSRVRRNKGLVRILKELYTCQCQLCGEDSSIPEIIKEDGDSYVEVHHIKEISQAQSNDDIEQIDSYRNTIVVCPFHHSYLHHQHGGRFLLNDKKNALVNKSGDEVKIKLDYHLCYNGG